MQLDNKTSHIPYVHPSLTVPLLSVFYTGVKPTCLRRYKRFLLHRGFHEDHRGQGLARLYNKNVTVEWFGRSSSELQGTRGGWIKRLVFNYLYIVTFLVIIVIS